MVDVIPREVVTEGEDETRALGRRLGARLVPGDLVGLRGPLGAGKTRLVQGLCAGLGVAADQVASPTFALVNTYDGRVPVLHVDLYRVADVEEVEDTGLLDLVEGAVTLVEWIDRAPEVAGSGALLVDLDDLGGERRRIRFSGAAAARILGA